MMYYQKWGTRHCEAGSNPGTRTTGLLRSARN
jgi:hypothetical protein